MEYLREDIESSIMPIVPVDERGGFQSVLNPICEPFLCARRPARYGPLDGGEIERVQNSDKSSERERRDHQPILNNRW